MHGDTEASISIQAENMTHLRGMGENCQYGSVPILGLLTGVNSYLATYLIGESEYCGHPHQPRKSTVINLITQSLQHNHTHKGLLMASSKDNARPGI